MSGGRTHRPELDQSKCEVCGGCTFDCPAAVFPELAEEKNSIRGVVFSNRTYEGKPDDMPPCRMACPLGQNVPEYITAIAREDIKGAAAVIRETNALPSVCGRVCIASCMRACTKAYVGQGVDIRGLKRFAVHVVGEVEKSKVKGGAPSVAVVGGGPAGLAAAHRLVQLGLRAVVFETADKAGGMLVDAIPPFVLPREMVAVDVKNLERMGVEIRTGVQVGKDPTWSKLKDDFDAVLVTTGSRRAVKQAIPGEELEGATNAIEFCRNACNGTPLKIDGSVVVQGGAKPSLQAARTALRLGAKSVHVVHPAPLDLWSAGSDAIRIAEEEGVVLRPEHRVKELIGSGGKLGAVTVSKVRNGKPDGVGRPERSPDGAKSQLNAKVFVATPERQAQKDDQPNVDNIKTGVLGNLQVDSDYRLPISGWYAAGEAATGAATVVDSMATGRLAADSIGRDLAAKREAS